MKETPANIMQPPLARTAAIIVMPQLKKKPIGKMISYI